MGKLKRADDVTDSGYQNKHLKADAEFVWDEDEWTEDEEFKADVTKMVPKNSSTTSLTSVVKKVASAQPYTDGRKPPEEVQFLKRIRACNRIVKPFHVSYNDSDEEYHTYNVFYEEYELGDLVRWRNQTFLFKNGKRIPEAHLWRFLVHMAQALSVVHDQAGSKKKRNGTLVHRDIKPDNILVAKNGSSAYPSFRLHDFDIAKVALGPDHQRSYSYSGTYCWQPPESPYINTAAADIWSVGACVHYLAFGTFITKPMHDDWLGELDEEVRQDALKFRNKYSSERSWYHAYATRVITAINLGEASDNKLYGAVTGPRYKPKYSDRLNYWMMECLQDEPSDRPSAQRLLKEMVPEAREVLLDLGGDKALVDFDLEFY